MNLTPREKHFLSPKSVVRNYWRNLQLIAVYFNISTVYLTHYSKLSFRTLMWIFASKNDLLIDESIKEWLNYRTLQNTSILCWDKDISEVSIADKYEISITNKIF